MKKKSYQHGGARKGAGRPKLKEPKVQIYFRVPESKRKRCQRMLAAYLKKMLEDQQPNPDLEGI